MVAGSTASGKSKGRELQKYVASSICCEFGLPESDAVSRPMGSSGSDIMMSNQARKVFPFSIECKRQENLKIGPWMDQACANAAKDRLAPLLVLRQNRDEAIAVLLSKHLAAIVEGVGYPEGVKPSMMISSGSVMFKTGIQKARLASKGSGGWVLKTVSPRCAYSLLPYLLLLQIVRNYSHSPDTGGLAAFEAFTLYSGEQK